MTTRWPSSCSRAASSISTYSNGSLQQQLLLVRRRNNGFLKSSTARYISSSPRRLDSKDKQDARPGPEKAALVAIQNGRNVHTVNPPSSTLPPPLKLPERGDSSTPIYYFKIGRAYGSFYWLGLKAVWFNHQAVKLLKARLPKPAKEGGPGQERASPPLERLSHLTRAEHQLLARDAYDIGKLPFFGVLVCIFGEWLPLIVPFIPSAVPGTCRIPKQIRGMRAKAEDRRRVAFRNGISEPSKEQFFGGAESKDTKQERKSLEWPTTRKEHIVGLLTRLRDDQLYHLSSVLNLHNRFWDRIQLPPPSFLLRRALSRNLTYLASDDFLLLKSGDKALNELLPEEVAIACEQRGIDVLGKRDETLRKELWQWLKKQKADGGKGKALFTMLFRRPNAWDTKVDR
ncbi:unnamed protein product [Zymoseptoria tritici ST99CH_3D7]|uniref:Letm1 RBD domain-containing protein n=1 Tax=Zymoseptoria tritici (strain ST99CH_3D7) TaxID=1276538 RepID=A0A1X7S7E1_ZYMT9|nr:unnamed protein product [Zymoseptoria tritici ST99CH_3D7]